MQVNRIENEALKQVFRNLNAKIIKEVSPDSVIDKLFARNLITADDVNKLSRISDPKVRCGDLLCLLQSSSHPETFIQLREALVKEHLEIVDEVNEQLTSLTAQQQRKLHEGPCTGLCYQL